MNRLVLLTNDDGYHAAGLQLLIRALEGIGDIHVVAPASEQSATSHSLTLRRRIEVKEIAPNHYTVDGTPTDSVLLAVTGMLERKPDLIVSGINHGPNMGEDVTYSGTVAAAIEGVILGVPSIALSSLQRTIVSTEEVARVARVVVESALDFGVPEGCLLNVNIPDPSISKIKAVHVTKLGSRAYDNLLKKETGNEGDVFFTIGGKDPVWKADHGSDISAVRNGYVSVTPLHLDLTHYKAIVEMERWRFEL